MACPICTKTNDANIDSIMNSKKTFKLSSLYKCVKFIAKGGTSRVYVGINKKNGKEVALKVIKDKYAKNNSSALYREITSQLYLQDKPYIKDRMPTIYNIQYVDMRPFGRYEGVHIVVEMEYIKGVAVNKYLYNPNKKLSQANVISIFKQSLMFIDSLYKHGYVHRDIKPDNMIYNEDTNILHIIDYSFICNATCNNICIEKCRGMPHTRSYAHIDILERKEIHNYLTYDIYSLALSVLYLSIGRRYQWDETIITTSNIINRNKDILSWLKELSPDDEHFYGIISSILYFKGNINHKNILKELNAYKKYNNNNLIELILFNVKYTDNKYLMHINNLIKQL